MELSIDDNGGLDITRLSTSIESVMTDTGTVMSRLADTSSMTFVFVIFSAFAIGLYALMKYTSKKRLHRRGVEHGSARWANEKETKMLADKPEKKKGENPKPKLPFETDNNILLTQEVRMSLNTRQHRENLNVLVIGGSGSGKSRFYVKPNLMQLNTSYVVTDPKGELLRSCGRLMKKAGYEIRVFNLIDMAHSNNYNPFNYVYNRDKDGNIIDVNKTYVMKMVNCLMKNTKQEGSSGGDQFWDDSTKELTLAISFYLLERHQLEEQGIKFSDPAGGLDSYSMNFSMVMQVMKLAEISEQDENHRSPLDEMMDELYEKNPQSMAVTFYRDFKKAPAETAKSILISAAVRFAAFSLPEVADLTHTDNINLQTLGDKKTALFVIIPSSDATFNFLAAMMYTQLFDSLYDTANFKYGGRLPVHVRCLLDEFANIGTIPDFDKLLATMRSMEISANIIIQNLAQLKKMYDKSWEIVTGNCDSLLFLGGQEASTLEAISKSLGKETIDVVSQNRTRSHRSPSTSENNSIMGRELMTTDELKVMKPNQCVLIVRAFYPFFCHKFDIEKHPNYVYLEDSNSNYAYLIDDLHTEKMPNQKELHIDTIQPNEIKESEWREEEPMITDVEVPDDELDPETEMAEQAENTDTVFITEKATDERTASQKYFDINDDLEDVDELPDDIVPYDMAALEVITEESLKAMDLF
ncbi:MAG: type IV secretory system conjugative DNA transfer family protein [Oscillospiraceae bacterium]|nr:type IV secretory system conjugative DNA transfer family protein [Oscillospiraceae bacterium]